jgi:hypothetical protein
VGIAYGCVGWWFFMLTVVILLGVFMTQLTKDDFENNLRHGKPILWIGYNNGHGAKEVYIAFVGEHFYAYHAPTKKVGVISAQTLLLAVMDHHIYEPVAGVEKDWRVMFGILPTQADRDAFLERFKRDFCLPIPAKADDANQGSGDAET